MTIDDCIKACSYIKDFDIRALAHRIGDAYEKHEQGVKLDKLDKFVLGLRYYEFYATKDTNDGYERAYKKQQLMLEKLKLDRNSFYRIVEEETGLK